MTNKEILQNIEDSLVEYGSGSISGDTIKWLISRIRTQIARKALESEE